MASRFPFSWFLGNFFLHSMSEPQSLYQHLHHHRNVRSLRVANQRNSCLAINTGSIMSPSLIRIFPKVKITLLSSTIRYNFSMFLLSSSSTKIPILLKSFWILLIFLRLFYYSYFIFVIFKWFFVKLYVQIINSSYVFINLPVYLLNTISCILCLPFLR